MRTPPNLATPPPPGAAPPNPPRIALVVLACFVLAALFTEGVVQAAAVFASGAQGLLALVQAWRWWRG